jgi:hypothetical protein
MCERTLTRTVDAMQVTELWRFAVKSMQGERLDVAHLGPAGIDGDRQWALVDQDTGFGLTARRVPQLLLASARLVGTDAVEVELPDGSIVSDDEQLSSWLGRRVALQRASEPTTYEIAADFEDEAGSEWRQWTGPSGSFHDSEAQVSILSTGSIGGWDRRRFRGNVIVDADEGDEDALVGRKVRIGAARVDVVAQIERCVMTTRPQPGGIDRDLGVLRTINAQRNARLGVGAVVVEPGNVRLGDEVG